MQNKVESLTLRKSADSRCRMQRAEHITKMFVIRQAKREVTTQMHQIAGTSRIGAILIEVTRELFQTLRDISGNVTLFLNILGTPHHVLTLAIQVVALQFHGSCQCHRLPLTAVV